VGSLGFGGGGTVCAIATAVTARARKSDVDDAKREILESMWVLIIMGGTIGTERAAGLQMESPRLTVRDRKQYRRMWVHGKVR
jgi:hypothetical protein